MLGKEFRKLGKEETRERLAYSQRANLKIKDQIIFSIDVVEDGLEEVKTITLQLQSVSYEPNKNQKKV
jgi:ASC-1-like (ASCH) protein